MARSPLFRSLLVLASLSLGLAVSSATAQDQRLGDVDFPNSGAPGAQPAFERGLLLLHSFEYGPAASAFREAREIDPDFAMAYWGEAMTHNHPVWFRQDRDAALEVLAAYAATPAERASRAANEASQREADWMRAIDVLYGEGTKEARDLAYERAMSALHAAYPDDAEAAAFHALALLGTAHDGRDFATYMKSAGILEQVVDDHPRHPGIAHYLIHSYDDPIHAPLGIRAARAYSDIAPDAAHAQHMTSHIFVALGMWEDVVTANENSMRVVNASRAERGLPPGACGHYNSWLSYGYLQQGRAEDARRLVRECYERVLHAAGDDVPDPDNSPVGSYASMVAAYVVDAGESNPDVLDWPVDLSSADYARANHSYARALAAYGRDEAAGLREAVRDFGSARDAIEAAYEPGDADGQGIYQQRVAVMQAELDALLAAAAGDLDGAIAAAEHAAAAEAEMPFEFGPPFIPKPTYELLGEFLLEAGRPDDARSAFETALGRTPGRVATLEGLAASGSPLATASSTP